MPNEIENETPNETQANKAKAYKIAKNVFYWVMIGSVIWTCFAYMPVLAGNCCECHFDELKSSIESYNVTFVIDNMSPIEQNQQGANASNLSVYKPA